jgi:hypothetical protein
MGRAVLWLHLDESQLHDLDAFPGCHRPSQDCDLDHIEAYIPRDEGGPPGQTCAGGLAPLCRRHHRAKTHTPWTYHRLPDGGSRWTTPLRPHPRRTLHDEDPDRRPLAPLRGPFVRPCGAPEPLAGSLSP